MIERRTIVASKQGVTLPFFPVKLKTAQKQKAYSVQFTTGGMRLFVGSMSNVGVELIK